MSAPKRIVLGSGTLHVQALAPSTEIDTAAKIEALCTTDNIIGYIKGGATLTYTPSFYTAVDDLGFVTKTIITEEEVTLKSGIMTFAAASLKKLCATGRVTDESGTSVLKIGGISNADNAKYAVIFHHEDEADGDIYVCIVGTNQSGFTLAFAKDQETVIDAEFRALAQDESGTLITYVEKPVASGN